MVQDLETEGAELMQVFPLVAPPTENQDNRSHHQKGWTSKSHLAIVQNKTRDHTAPCRQLLLHAVSLVTDHTANRAPKPHEDNLKCQNLIGRGGGRRWGEGIGGLLRLIYS